MTAGAVCFFCASENATLTAVTAGPNRMCRSASEGRPIWVPVSYRAGTPAAFSTATRIAACFSALSLPPPAVT